MQDNFDSPFRETVFTYKRSLKLSLLKLGSVVSGTRDHITGASVISTFTTTPCMIRNLVAHEISLPKMYLSGN